MAERERNKRGTDATVAAASTHIGVMRTEAFQKVLPVSFRVLSLVINGASRNLTLFCNTPMIWRGVLSFSLPILLILDGGQSIVPKLISVFMSI